MFRLAWKFLRLCVTQGEGYNHGYCSRYQGSRFLVQVKSTNAKEKRYLETNVKLMAYMSRFYTICRKSQRSYRITLEDVTDFDFCFPNLLIASCR